MSATQKRMRRTNKESFKITPKSMVAWHKEGNYHHKKHDLDAKIAQVVFKKFCKDLMDYLLDVVDNPTMYYIPYGLGYLFMSKKRMLFNKVNYKIVEGRDPLVYYNGDCGSFLFRTQWRRNGATYHDQRVCFFRLADNMRERITRRLPQAIARKEYRRYL